MSISVADVFEDYIESLQNLPFEVDQSMQELRRMDDDLQKYRETYTRSKKTLIKQSRVPNLNNLVRLQLDKEFKTAMQKQDQKIELAMKMYDLVSRHIERLDSQVLKTGMSESEWVCSRVVRKGPLGNRKRPMAMVDRPRKRLNPSFIGHTSTPPELASAEPLYCYCNQVSFGDMVACDSENCEREWFHYPCAGLVDPPAGKWYCEDCKPEQYSYKNDTSDQSTSSSSSDDDE